MIPPQNANVIDLPTAIMWRDEEYNILCANSKKGPTRTPEVIQETLEEFQNLMGGQKIRLLLDITHVSEITREGRDYIAEEFPKHIEVLALYSQSVFGTMVANIFFAIKSQPYPTKMFTDIEQAKIWLSQQAL